MSKTNAMRGAKKAEQARSRRTRDALLAALESLLKEKDFSEIGVVEIADRAGVSPASIYRRFNKRDGLIPALFELQLRRQIEWYQRADTQKQLASLSGENVDLKSFLRGNAHLALLLLRDLEHLAKPTAIYGRMRPDLLQERVDEMMKDALQSVRKALEPYRSHIARADDDRTIHMVVYFFQCIFNDFVLFRDRTVMPGFELSDEVFVFEIADFLYGYLTTPEDTP